MKELSDLSFALHQARSLGLIESYITNSYFIDIDFVGRDTFTTEKILRLREYIYSNYGEVASIDYMPIINRLRLYLCHHSMSAE